MIKEVFIGHKPSHFRVNPTVRAFILSESIFWSAWSIAMPIFAVFATNDIQGGSVEIAASVVSVYLIVRIICELLSGKYLARSTNYRKFYVTIIGTFIIGLSFLGFAYSHTIPLIFLFYAIAGIGIGIASPAKNSLFSTHLDKNRETNEWGLYDASVFVGMAAATALGGFIAKLYGFQILFLASAGLTFVGIIPYLLFINHFKHDDWLGIKI